MRVASWILSLCLHGAVFLAIWFWPVSAPVRPDAPPILISLVDGAMGGNQTPSPILGPMGDTADGPQAPSLPAPQSDVASPAREESRPKEPDRVKEIDIPEKAPEAPAPVPVPEPKPQPPEPKPVEIPKPEARTAPKPEQKKPEEKKPQPKKAEPKKPEPKKPAQPKQPAPKKAVDPVAAALQQARKATSRASSGDRGSAVEQALAQAQKSASGNRGGGGGEGRGPGGGGIGDVYVGQVMLAVRPNWGFASGGRKSLVCTIKVTVDMNGKVTEAVVSKSSGNAQYDASAVNAIIRTSNAGDFPVPPNISYTELDLVFTMDELMGR